MGMRDENFAFSYLQPQIIMMKSFIIAVTSISYILSIANIVDAKIKTSAKKNTREKTCLNQIITASKQSKLSQSSVISTEDIRGICQAIKEEYAGNNNSIRNLAIADRNFTPFKDFIEVEKINLTNFEVQKSHDGERKYTRVDIVEIVRPYLSTSMKELPDKSSHNTNPITIYSYNWEPNPAKAKMTTRTRRTCVQKLQGKWSVNTYHCEINSKK
jgi:hypothetical protein